MTGLFLLGAGTALQNARANGDTRTLSFHHLHTDETITVTFKRDGRYDEAALKKLDWFMRDWRKDQSTHMDPQLFDLLWEVYREVGGSKPIDIICGYRSPGTNAMLRARSRGVARNSQHINGKAMDFAIPGVPLDLVRAVGLRLQRGGVGFYPSSGSPFVHMDTSTIRHWPRISRVALQRIFPDGRTVHVPADGRPLRNYALALADVEARGQAPSGSTLEQARMAGVITASQEQQADQIAQSAQGAQARQPGLLARLFGAGARNDDDHDAAEPAPAAAPAAPKTSRAPMVLASALPPAKPVEIRRIVPLPAARPKPVVVASAKPQAPVQPAAAAPAKQQSLTTPVVTASLRSKPVTERNIWGDPLRPRNVWNNPVVVGQRARSAETPFKVASAEPEPETTGSAGTGDGNGAMAYAPERTTQVVKRARPMGKALPQMPRQATVIPTPRNASVAVKPPPMVSGSQRSNSPWLRAAMLTPSVRGYLTATRLVAIEPQWLSVLIAKPAQALVASFSADPHLGMTADRFSGHAVEFLATATFRQQTTASLR